MKKKLVAGLATGVFVFLFGMVGLSQAALQIIGTATYATASNATNNTSLSTTENVYNLIWDNDNNGNSVVWLDYTNSMVDGWQLQKDWATSLNGSSTLIYNIDPGYTVVWGATNSWRLPDTVDVPYVTGNTDNYNNTNSEMGHLYYTELGNLGYFDTSGNAQSGYGLVNTGDFNNLIAGSYWSETAFGDDLSYSWAFRMHTGGQFRERTYKDFYGLAIRSGDVSAVPVPGAIWLLGSGLLGLAGVSRKKR